MNRPTWDKRIERAVELGEILPFAAEILGFYATVTRFQKALYGYIRQVREKSPPDPSFREALDLPLLLPRFPGFLKVIKEAAPAALASYAEQISAENEPRWEQLLRYFWRGGEPPMPYPEIFFARAFLQPYAEFVAERVPESSRQGDTRTCTVCESQPVVGVMRERQLGAKRSFVCSLCAYEWDFPRSVCPGCGEDRHDVLAVFTSEGFEHVRVEACDTCKCYIKTVDLTNNGLAVPVVDELATVPLTLWAQEHGYSKLQANLLAV